MTGKLSEQEIDRQDWGSISVGEDAVVMKRELSQKLKLSIHRSIDILTLTYGHELWVETEKMRPDVYITYQILSFIYCKVPKLQNTLYNFLEPVLFLNLHVNMHIYLHLLSSSIKCTNPFLLFIASYNTESPRVTIVNVSHTCRSNHAKPGLIHDTCLPAPKWTNTDRSLLPCANVFICRTDGTQVSIFSCSSKMMGKERGKKDR